MVRAWMLNSLTPTIATSVESLSSAAEMWMTLETMYSGKGNVMVIAQVEDMVHDMKQGERSVLEYVADLQHLWTDLDHYDPLLLSHAECVLAAQKWIERRQVMKFLKGLNLEFEGGVLDCFINPLVLHSRRPSQQWLRRR